jgi:hypothetical protein
MEGRRSGLVRRRRLHILPGHNHALAFNPYSPHDATTRGTSDDVAVVARSSLVFTLSDAWQLHAYRRGTTRAFDENIRTRRRMPGAISPMSARTPPSLARSTARFHATPLPRRSYYRSRRKCLRCAVELDDDGFSDLTSRPFVRSEVTSRSPEDVFPIGTSGAGIPSAAGRRTLTTAVRRCGSGPPVADAHKRKFCAAQPWQSRRPPTAPIRLARPSIRTARLS